MFIVPAVRKLSPMFQLFFIVIELLCLKFHQRNEFIRHSFDPCQNNIWHAVLRMHSSTNYSIIIPSPTNLSTINEASTKFRCKAVSVVRHDWWIGWQFGWNWHTYWCGGHGLSWEEGIWEHFLEPTSGRCPVFHSCCWLILLVGRLICLEVEVVFSLKADTFVTIPCYVIRVIGCHWSFIESDCLLIIGWKHFQTRPTSTSYFHPPHEL